MRGEVKAHTAEAAADVERAMAAFEQQFGRDVPLLGELRLLERLPLTLKVSAGILHVGIEKEVVQPMIEVVVRGDVAAGLKAVVAAEVARNVANFLQRLDPGGIAGLPEVRRAERREFVEIAADHVDPAVHVEFADLQFGVAQQLRQHFGIVNSHGEVRAASVSETFEMAVWELHLKPTGPNNSVDDPGEPRAHFSFGAFYSAAPPLPLR